MGLQIPGSSGNFASLVTALTTAGATVFFRFQMPSLPTAGRFVIAIESSSTSVKTGGGALSDGNALHGLFIESAGSGVYALNDLAYWDSDGSAALLTGIAPGTWINGSYTFYSASSRPAIKLALRPDGGSIVTRVRNPSWWGGIYDTFTNPRVTLGASNGGSNPSNARLLDIFMYPSAITSDTDIEDQFDSLSDEHASLYWKTLFRGYADVASAVAKEAGSASPSAWTVAGTLSIDNSTDGESGGQSGPTLSGGGVIGVTDSGTAPATPTGFTVTATSPSSVTLSWTASAGATGYAIYGRKVATESDWELYQTFVAPPGTITELEPRVLYGFKLAAYNASGGSALTSEVTATTGNLRLRLRATVEAAGKVCNVAIRRPSVPPSIIGEPLGTYTGVQFEADTVFDATAGIAGETVAEMFIEIDPDDNVFGSGLSEGDVLEAYVEKTDRTEGAWIMRDVTVQLV